MLFLKFIKQSVKFVAATRDEKRRKKSMRVGIGCMLPVGEGPEGTVRLE